MSRFAGKAAVVTGAGRGIGAAVAGALAAEGAAVGLMDLDGDALERGVAAIERAGGSACALVADVRSEPDVEAASARAVAELGGIDLLASFAGVVGYGALPDFEAAEWDRILATNAKGPFLCAKHAIPAMRRRGGGAIVLTSSIMAFASDRTAAAYSASKGAVAAMTRAMAIDHAEEGIRVNALVPGVVRTELLEDAAAQFEAEDKEALIESWGQRQPLGRVIEPAEVAAAALFLLSDGASAITGSCIPVDGGLLAKLG
jgi:NAD(P)-dependent dehydrogenase (short-subunit alcohol dehydrogenase family)